MEGNFGVDQTLFIEELDRLHSKIASNNRKLKRIEDKLDNLKELVEDLIGAKELEDWEDKDVPF